MAAAKSAAQRQKEFRAGRVEKGMKEVHNIWAHKDDHEEIKAYAEMVYKRRHSLDSNAVSFNHKLWEPVKDWMLNGGEPPAWAKRDGGIFLAFDEVTIAISNATVTQKFYYKGDLFITKTFHLLGSDFSSLSFKDPLWMGPLITA